jgi:hypothetical protein
VNKDLVVMSDNSNKELSKLKPMLNNPLQWEAFNKYLDSIIYQQQIALEQSDNQILMHRSQGAISALRRLKQIRDIANGK